MSSYKFNTLVDMARNRAEEFPDRIAYTFVTDGGAGESTMTYRELDQAARMIARRMEGREGQRALLIYPSGLEYIRAFFGCLYAGVIAVPVYPPRLRQKLHDRNLKRIQAIIKDSLPGLALTEARTLARLTDMFPTLPDLERLDWFATDSSSESDSEFMPDFEHIRGDAVAFIQYTSGSTGTPRGVTISHRNILSNQEMIRHFGNHDENSRLCTWLPLFHDLGLIVGVIQPLYQAIPCFFTAPASFLRDPLLWLRMITRYKATTTGAPNFAYDLCASRVRDEDKETIDLSSLTHALNGSEPLRASAIRNFQQAFASCNLSPHALSPGYGLAEATCAVTGGNTHIPPVRLTVDAQALEKNRIRESRVDSPGSRTLLGCGRPTSEQEIAIVDPETNIAAAADMIGEIWLRGPNVARGYWNRDEETAETFGALRADEAGDSPWLRTGDLGFLRDGELFVTGRLKDLIIINGRNHYPTDIEQTVENAHPLLVNGSGAAFSITHDQKEALVVVQEAERGRHSLDLDQVFASIREAVAVEHDLGIHSIVLLKTASLPRTTSGKIQRRASREKFLKGELKEVARRGPEHESAAPPPAISDAPPGDLLEWMQGHIAALLDKPSEQVALDKPFAYLGLNSVLAVRMLRDLEEHIGKKLDPTLAFEFPTIRELVDYLKADLQQPGTGLSAAPTGISSDADLVAITGIGCVFPGGVKGPESFWNLLREGREAISEVPAGRWDWREYYDANQGRPGCTVSRWGGFLDDIESFDPSLFSISPREAAVMDPQQRLSLRAAWNAFEDAGYDPRSLAGSAAGVFTGICGSEYGVARLGMRDTIDPYTHTGSGLSIAANRVSYTFDLRGPSMSIDTACSSSLYAIQAACSALNNGSIDMALAGGVNLLLLPEVMVGFSQLRALSPTGKCRPFDHRADGIVRGEGAGYVVLKKLSRARRDGDRIYAIIRGVAVNQDGRSFGLTAPNGASQADLLRNALKEADVPPESIQYVEAHGTGTPLGDPIETKALSTILSGNRERDFPCRIGSVKSNIGHLEAAAGIAGLIKTALMLHHRTLVPSLNFEKANENITLDDVSLRVALKTEPWQTGHFPARAGISSFGFGGANAHVVLEEAPRTEAMGKSVSPDQSRTLLFLSAHTEPALSANVRSYSRFLRNNPDVSAGDVCRTAALHRGRHAHRVAFTASDRDELVRKLELFARGETAPGIEIGQVHPPHEQGPVFVFSGQGGRWLPLDRSIMSRPAFSRVIDEAERFYAEAGWSLKGLLFDTPEHENGNIDIMRMQPAFFAVQVAFARLWESWGLSPGAAVGHSIGEIAAAHIAGAIDFESGCRIALERGKAPGRSAAGGKMALVEKSEEDTRALLAQLRLSLDIAAVNAPESVVVSGAQDALRNFVAEMQKRDIFARELESVDFASHSRYMEQPSRDLVTALKTLRSEPPALPFYSSLRGERVRESALDPEYWGRNIREPVLFDSALRAILADGHRMFIEISPRTTLVGLVERALRTADAHGVCVPSRRHDSREDDIPVDSLARLAAHGLEPDWRKFFSPGPPVSLPEYAFDETIFPLNIRRESRIDEPNRRVRPTEIQEEESGVVSVFYDYIAHRARGAEHTGELFLTFGPFRRPNRDFSWLRAFCLPEQFPDERRELVQSQIELRDILFRSIDMSGVRRALDIGCGYGADLISLATKYEHIQVDGFTLSGVQAKIARNRIKSLNLGDRVNVFRCDSSREPFPDQYQLAFGLEVAGHVQDKSNLFKNISEHLVNGGYLLLADFISESLSSVEVDETASYSSTVEEWAEVLAEHKLRLRTCVDISPEVANFLEDEDFQKNVDALASHESEPPPPEVIAYVRSYQNLGAGFRAGFLSYVLLTIQKDEFAAFADIRRSNEEALRFRVNYDQVQELPSDDRAAEQVSNKWYYNIRWTANGVASPSVAKNENPGTWLIVPHLPAVGREISERLKEYGDDGIIVMPGADKRRKGDEFRIRLDNHEDVQWLAKNIRGEVKGLIHLRSLGGDKSAVKECAALANLIRGFFAVESRGISRVRIFTQNAQATEFFEGHPPPESAVSPTGAALWGFTRVCAAEHSETDWRIIDISGDHKSENIGIDMVMKEILSDDMEDQVAYHGGIRYAARIVAQESFADVAGMRTSFVREDSSYLITGGTGDLGLLLARNLVERGARHLILISRSGPAAREQNPEVDLALTDMEEKGARIKLLALDVASRADMRKQLVDTDHPPIRGIIHAAGTTDDRPVLQMDAKSLRKVFRSKVTGAEILDELFGTANAPDFFILFSSASVLMGQPGQANYAAANAALDALAINRFRRGLPALSINWGVWRGLGMAATENGERLTRHLERLGVRAIEKNRGLAAMEHLRSFNLPQIAYFGLDLDKLMAYHPAARTSPLFQALKAETPPADSRGMHGAFSEDLKSLDDDARAAALEKWLQGHLQRILRLPRPPAADQALHLLGTDSLMAVEIKNLAEGEFGVALPVRSLVEGAAIRDIAARIARSMAGQAPPENSETGAERDLGPFPITPGQGWLFEHELANPHHWNATILLRVPEDLDHARLLRAAKTTIERHDSLLGVFQPDNQTWFLKSRSADMNRIFSSESIDSSNGAPGALIEECVARINTELHIYDGPLVRIAHIKDMATGEGRVFVAIHHLACDAFGLVVFIKELIARYSGTVGALPSVPGYGAYAKSLRKLGADLDVSRHLEYWKNLKPKAGLPIDKPDGVNTEGTQARAHFFCDERLTDWITRKARAESGFGQDVVLLAAFMLAYADWSGRDELLLEYETHGRDAHPTFDISSTAGWCNIMHPLLLRRAGAGHDTLKVTREILAGVPDGGFSYGLLRYMSSDEARENLVRLPEPEVKFINHGPVFDQMHQAVAPWEIARESRGPIFAPENKPRHSLYMYAAQFQGRLRIELVYGNNLFNAETIANLLNGIKENLTALGASLTK